MARGSDACPYSEASVSDLCDGFGSLEQILFGLLTSGQDPKILHRGFPGDPGFGSASALDVGDSCSAWDHHEGETGTFRHSASTNASTGPLTESANAESLRQPRTCQTNNFTNDMLHFSFSGWGNTFDPFGMDSSGSEIGSSTSSPLFRNDHGITMTSLPPTLSSEMTPVRPEIRVPPSAAACSCDDTTTASAFNDDEATRQDESCSGDDCGSTPPMAGINTIWEMDRKDYHALSPKERRRVRNRVSARVARAKRRGELAFLSGKSLSAVACSTL